MEQNLILMIMVNTTIISIFYVTIRFMTSLPARTRFYLCLVALLSSFIPWPFVKLENPPTVVDQVTQARGIVDDFIVFTPEENYLIKSITTNQASTKNIHSSSDEMLKEYNLILVIALLVSMIGTFLFCRDLILYRAKVNSLLKNSNPAIGLKQSYPFLNSKVSVRVLNKNISSPDSPGMATGIFQQIIWINEDLDEKSTVLLHESTHTKQHDPRWLWLITFVQRIFWWNPIVLITCTQARKELELSCDEACNKLLKDDQYSKSLLKILSDINNGSSQHQAITNIGMSKKFNIKRIENLMELKKIKFKHIISIIFCMLSVTTIGISFANNLEESRTERMKKVIAKSRMETAYEYSDKEIEQALSNADPRAVANVINALSDHQEFNKADKIIKQWKSTHTDSLNSLRNRHVVFRAEIYLLGSQYKYEDIVNLFEKTYKLTDLGNDIQSIIITTLYARSLAHIGKNELAIKVLNTKLKDLGKSSQQNSIIYEELGTIYHAMKNYEDSIASFEKTKRRTRDRNLAINYYKLGKFEIANELWQKVRNNEKLNIEHQNIRLGLINRISYSLNSKYKRKIFPVRADNNIFPSTMSRFENLYGYDENISELIKERRKWKEISNILLKILEENQGELPPRESIRLKILLSQSYGNGQQKNKSLNLVDNLLSNPNLPEAEKAHLLFNAAHTASYNNQFEKAFDYLTQYESMLGQPAKETQILTGLINFRAGKYKEAISILEPAIKEVENSGFQASPIIYRALSSSYASENNLEDAIAIQTKFVDFYPNAINKERLTRLKRQKN